MSDPRTQLLKTTPNENPDRDYTIEHVSEELTFLYPITEQPCFGTIALEYVPEKSCIEMMSFKQYLNSFRDDAVFFETLTNRIFDDLNETCSPRSMAVEVRFNVRGGISSTVSVSTPP